MIAKRVIRTGGTSFKRLGAYVLAEQNGGRGDPVDWKLGDYVLDQAHAGEKVAWAHATNCRNDDLGWAVTEILATQARNTRARTDLSYHLVVSFPDGERPTRAQLEDIEQSLCQAIGLGEHQRIAAVHQNTDNWHMHVAINRVHPETFRAVEPYYDQYRLQEACVELEIRHDLTRDNHSPVPERPLNGRASEMEAHAGRISFARWVAEHAAAPLAAAAAQAGSWHGLHQMAAGYGLVIKPRGAGLIVMHQTDGRIRMKASAVDRSLSFKALSDRLGPYEPPAPALSGVAPSMSYAGTPTDAMPQAGGLWAQYQAERQAAMDARKTAVTELRHGHARYAHELTAWYRTRYAAARAAHLNRGDRISTYRTLGSERTRDHTARRAREKTEREQVRDRFRVITWSDFLAREAGRGDVMAMQALKRSGARQVRTGVVSDGPELG